MEVKAPNSILLLHFNVKIYDLCHLAVSIEEAAKAGKF